MLHIKPMTQEKFDQYKEWSVADYAEDLIKSGIATKENAFRESIDEFAEILPNGMQTIDSFLYMIVNMEGEEIGLIWYGRDCRSENTAFVFDFLINPEHRRKGFGTEALRLVEEEAKAGGYKKIGLNVFKFNTAAYALYQKMGYLTSEEFEGNMILYKNL